jgi:hypothetical protein
VAAPYSVPSGAGSVLPPGSTHKSWGSNEVRGSAIADSSGHHRPLVLYLGRGAPAGGGVSIWARRVTTAVMATEPQPLTLAEAAHKAVEVCDDGTSNELEDIVERFEDADEPITAIDDIDTRLNETLGDPEDGDPAFKMARAVIAYLAYRRDEIGEEPDRLLQLAARAEFDGQPPPDVAEWLEQRGVKA